VKVRAAVLDEPKGPFALRELDLREPHAGEVLVEVVAVGLCHTDLNARRPAIPMSFPIVLGHEGAGIVRAVGSAVTTVEPGDHVVLTYDSCGQCRTCATGRPAYCEEFLGRNLLGRSLDGSTTLTDGDLEVSGRWFGQSSWATHAIASERSVVRIDRDVPLELAAPLGCGLMAGAGAVVNTLGLRLGDSLTVYGVGPVGLAAIMAARAVGAGTLIAVDVHQKRRKLALELGADLALDGTDEDLGQQVRAATGGCDLALDTTGHPAVMNTALAGLRSAGTLAVVGASSRELGLDYFSFVNKRVVFAASGDSVPQDFIPRLVALWRQGRFPLERLVATLPLDQVNEAEALARDGSIVKPVLLTAERN
jgi:aryl-alcohol dehydrogenase